MSACIVLYHLYFRAKEGEGASLRCGIENLHRGQHGILISCVCRIRAVFQHRQERSVALVPITRIRVPPISILWVSAIASAIVDNIPLVIAMLPLIKTVIPAFALQMGIADDTALIHSTIAAPLYWALALGACLGGNGTLIGASANVVIAQVGKRNNCDISFLEFTKAGFPIMVLTAAISSVYLYLRYF